MALLDLSAAPHGGSQRHLPEWQSQPRITPTTIIDHSIVGTGEQGFQHFMDSSNLESHFIVCGAGDRSDGWIYQLMDTDHQADANLNANGYAISIETGDQGDPDHQPWTRAQLESLAWLHERLVQVHPTIPRRQSSSCTLPGGLGYHTLHGAPSCWTPVAKTCPGTVRKAQWREVLLPAFLAAQTLEADMPLNDADKVWIKGTIYRALLVVMSGQSNTAFTSGEYGEFFDGEHPSLNEVLADAHVAATREVPVQVDEAAAAAIAQDLAANADFLRAIAVAVADETYRRQAG